MNTTTTLWNDSKKILEKFVLDQEAQSFSPRTIKERTTSLRAFFRKTGTEPQNFTAADATLYLATGKWGESTRATYYRTLKVFGEWCKRAKVRPDNPLEEVPAPREPRKAPRPLSIEAVELLLDTANRKRTRAYIMLAFYAGLRVSEIAKIRGEDIDIWRGEITVVGKGRVLARLPLHPELLKLAETMPTSGYWFPAYTGNKPHIRGDAISRAIKEVSTRAGLPDVTAHRLRHTYGTELVAAGVDLRTAQELLRHASLQTTQRYVATDSERMRAGVNLLPKI